MKTFITLAILVSGILAFAAGLENVPSRNAALIILGVGLCFLGVMRATAPNPRK